VCPASFDLGQHLNVTLLSVPEGDDKPQKYPVMFRTADLVLLTKCDLLQHIPEFRLESAHESLHAIACQAPVFHLSSRDSDSIHPWCAWLREQLARQRQRASAGEVHRPTIAPEGIEFHLAV
jgi:hydrogenase nickel incorporation protein HypB